MSATTPPTSVDGFGRGALLLAGSNAVYVVLGYAMTTVLARVLEPADFGGFGVVMAWITILTALLVKGITTATAREMASQEQPANAWRAGFGLGLRFALGLTVVGIAISELAAGWFGSDELVEQFAIGALGALTFGTNAVLLAWSTGMRRYGRQALAQLAYAVARVACVLGGAWIAGIDGAVVGYVAAPLVASLILLERRPAATMPLRELRARMARAVVPIAFASIAVTAFFIVDVFALSAELGAQSREVGIYIAYGTLAHVPFFLLQATSIAMVPAIAAAAVGAARADAIRRTLTDTVVLLAAPTLLLVTAGDAAARFVFGTDYHADSAIVAPLALATAAVTLLAGLLAVDVAIGRLRGALAIVLASVVALAVACSFAARAAEDPAAAVAWTAAAVSVAAMTTLAVHVRLRHGALLERRRAMQGALIGAGFALLPLAAGDHDILRTALAAVSAIAWLLLVLRLGIVDIRRTTPATEPVELTAP
ncbi:MAG: Membrane protein involved in the export of O-antigen and teichoic acid [Thermoleophilia bacterium]|nr:Membrane protein involved in the export of O-antigen and teichoic acid [Thermoleophilia bacterium]